MNHDETDNDPELERYVIAGLQAGERHARVPLALAAGARRRAARQRRAQLATVSTVLVLVGAAGAAAYAGGGIAPAPPAGGAGCAASQSQSTPRALPGTDEQLDPADLFLRPEDLGPEWAQPVDPANGPVPPQEFEGPQPALDGTTSVARAEDQLSAWGSFRLRRGADPQWWLDQRILRYRNGAAVDAFEQTKAELLCIGGAELVIADSGGSWVVVRTGKASSGGAGWSLLVRRGGDLLVGIRIIGVASELEVGTSVLASMAVAVQARIVGQTPPQRVMALPVLAPPSLPAGMPEPSALGEGWRLALAPSRGSFGSRAADLARCFPAWPIPDRAAAPGADVARSYHYWDGRDFKTLAVRRQRLGVADADLLMATGADCEAKTRSPLDSLRPGEEGWHYWLSGDVGIVLLRKGNTVATVTSRAELTDKDKLLEEVAPTILDSLE